MTIRPVSQSPRLYVGVGASVGGLAAFKALLRVLPADGGMAWLLVQHLAPDRESVLAELLGRETAMPVVAAEDGATVAADTVYVTPPGCALALRDGAIRLTELPAQDGLRMPVNHMFTSIAADAGSRGVGIVLSGGGRDGSEGLRALKSAGGLTIAHDPSSSEARSMPDSAIATGSVDLVLSFDEIPAALDRFARLPDDLCSFDHEDEDERQRDDEAEAEAGLPTSPSDDEELGRHAIATLAGALRETTGLDLGMYKPRTVARRVRRRMLLEGIDDLEDYLARVAASEPAQRVLLRDILINVTEFFRDPDAFAALRRLVVQPRVASTARGGTIRCWVPACATGQEAYSLAMLVLEEVEAQRKQVTLQLFATDVDEDALRVARAGMFPPSIAERLSAERIERHFERIPGRGYRVASGLRDRISFAVHDLTADPPFSRMAIVSCRNVLIYLTRERQERVLRSLHFALEEGGALFLGTSESSDNARGLFSPLSKSGRIYRRNEGVAPAPLSRPVREMAATRESWARRSPAPDEVIRDVAIELAMPPTVVVSGDDEIRFVHGELSPYLAFPKGQHPRLEVMTSVVPELAEKVRLLLFRCRRSKEVGSILCEGAGEGRTRVVARPASQIGDGAVVLTFEALSGAPDGRGPEEDDIAVDHAAAASFEAELRAMRDQLRDTVEQLESSNEELRASNEEAVSMNEELQSTNEELEATTEELRSVNEELITVNARLSEKVHEVEKANDDLSNFMRSANVPMVFLDAELRVQRFTPAAQRLLRLDHGDIGRPVARFTREGFDRALVDDVETVMGELTTRRTDVHMSDGRRLVRRALPYRTTSGRIGGVVVTFADVTELSRTVEALRESEQRLRIAQEAAGLGIQDCDLLTGEVVCDAKVRALWGLGEGERVDLDGLLSSVHDDDQDPLRRALDQARAPAGGGRFEATYRVAHRRSGEVRWLASTGQVFFDASDRPVRLVSTVQDVTEGKEIERLRVLLASIVAGSDDAIVSKTLDGTITSWNQGAERIFGYTAAEAVGRPIHLVIPRELHDEEDQILARLRQGERIEHFETQRVTKDNRRIDVSLTISPLVDERGRMLGASKIARDITAQKALAREIQAREESLRLAAEGASFGTFDIDLVSGRPVRSATLKRILGLASDADPPFEPLAPTLVHPEDADVVKVALAEALDPARGGVLNNEHRIVRPDGQQRWVLVKAQVHFSGKGNERIPLRMVGTVIDITDRKAAERLLAESEGRMRRLFDQAPAMIAVYEGPEHVCIYANPQYRRAVGGRPVVGRPLRQSLANLEGPDYFGRFDSVFATGETILTEAYEAELDRDGDGQLDKGYFTEILKPWFGPSQEVAGVMSFAFDVTAEVELLRRSEESEERFRTLADNIAQLAWMTDREGNVTWYNERWFDYTGTTHDEMKGWGWRKVHHVDHVDRVVAKIRRCFETGEHWEDTFPLRGKDGRYRWFLSRALPIRDEAGEIVRWFGTNTDVTDQRQTAEKLREADRRKDEFLAMLGHELRNPLAAITTATELLKVTKSEQPLVGRAADVLARQSAHMTRLVDGLLEVSRITRGKIELERAVLDLSRLLDELISDRSAQADKRGIAVRKELPSEPIWVDGDRIRLTQVFDNVFTNAVKFTDARGCITVSLEADEGMAEVRIRDTGVGIRAALLDTIFEPFQQETQELARVTGGLGLGLALARALVELHDGTIHAESAGPALGSTFVIRLPRSSKAQDRTGSDGGESPGPLRVLVVEDNPDAGDLMRTLLETQGHQVAMARDGIEALDILREEAFDVVMCDIGLPKMSGYEIAERVRADRALSDLPLVAITGYGQPEDRQRSEEAGFDAHLVKPVSLQSLNRALAHLTLRPAPGA